MPSTGKHREKKREMEDPVEAKTMVGGTATLADEHRDRIANLVQVRQKDELEYQETAEAGTRHEERWQGEAGV